ncbi:hypothetical protein BWGOE8_31750 [Bacillus mycoides]|uniref:Uncharacterized protein n=1 Tax=Bacillus mycoides TaxID=1405 RepID=A0A1E8B5I4_BACMY|nr:hypothetical protein BWGOE8_31750 [Bacillus mycoides]OFD77593.1 hypothetical protein BWGOE9_31810 [Bacillus mycoides]OFD78993.1 hypothetical protein BWGOE10_32230 [Bacillus mycoides]
MIIRFYKSYYSVDLRSFYASVSGIKKIDPCYTKSLF